MFLFVLLVRPPSTCCSPPSPGKAACLALPSALPARACFPLRCQWPSVVPCAHGLVPQVKRHRGQLALEPLNVLRCVCRLWHALLASLELSTSTFHCQLLSSLPAFSRLTSPPIHAAPSGHDRVLSLFLMSLNFQLSSSHTPGCKRPPPRTIG